MIETNNWEARTQLGFRVAILVGAVPALCHCLVVSCPDIGCRNAVDAVDVEVESFSGDIPESITASVTLRGQTTEPLTCPAPEGGHSTPNIRVGDHQISVFCEGPNGPAFRIGNAVEFSDELLVEVVALSGQSYQGSLSVSISEYDRTGDPLCGTCTAGQALVVVD